MTSIQKRILRFALSIALVSSTFAVSAESIEGHWEGAIEVPGTRLGVDIDLTFSEGSWSGDISIPLQNAKDLPLEGIAVDGAAVRFTIGGIPGTPTFDGVLDGDSISGDFSQGGQKFTFTLERAAPPTESAVRSLDGFDALVNDALDAWVVPGFAIAIVLESEVIYAKGFGFRDVENGVPVTPETLFAIGSSSKAFTTFALGTLADEGTFEWDMPVRHYLPEFELKDTTISTNITARDLVTHRSGLPRHDLLWYNNNSLTRAELVHRLRYLDANAGLREKWQYNNLMFLTAGYLLETLTNQTWEDVVRKRIFGPLGMKRSNLSVSESQQSDDFAWPYRKNDDDNLERIPFRSIDAMGPAGSINSSVNEMARWLIVHLSGGEIDGTRIINPSTLADMHTPHMVTGARSERPQLSPASYGLGWFVDTYRGHREVHHGGAIDGFIARVTLFPDDGLGIVALTNSGNALPTLLTRHAADRILGLEEINWNAEALAENAQAEQLEEESKEKKFVARRDGTAPSHPLDDYAGRYAHPGYGELIIETADSALTVSYNRITTPLEHWHYDVFNGGEVEDPTYENMKFMFRMDLEGNVASVEAGMEPFVDPIVFKKAPNARLRDPAFLASLAGEYVLGPRLVTISVKGSTLHLDVVGQPAYELEPALGDHFKLKILQGYSVQFKLDDAGRAVEAIFHQPNGVFTAKRR